MGACCVSRENYDDCLRYFFGKLPIRDIDCSAINDQFIEIGFDPLIDIYINDNYDKDLLQIEQKDYVSLKVGYQRESHYNRTLVQSNFNKFIYSYLQVQDYEEGSINFFLDVYKEIRHNIKYPVFKFILNTISKQDSYSKHLMIETLSYYSIYLTKMVDSSDLLMKSVKFIDCDYLIELLKYYIKLLSKYTLNSLMKPLMRENYSKETKIMYDDLWSDRIIEQFVKVLFFTEEERVMASRSIDVFVKNYHHILVSPELLINMLCDYSADIELSKDNLGNKDVKQKFISATKKHRKTSSF